MSKKKITGRIPYIGIYNKRFEDLKSNFEKALSKASNKNTAFEVFRHKFFEEYNNTWVKRNELYDFMNESSLKIDLDSSLTIEKVLIEHINNNEPDENFLSDYANFKANYDFVDYLQSFMHQDDSAYTKTPWEWNLDQRDFLKIIYGLHEGGFLKGQITKIVKEVSKRLEYPLSEDYYPNFSAGIHNNNADFDNTEIFKLLKIAFDKYQNTLIEKKRDKNDKKT